MLKKVLRTTGYFFWIVMAIGMNVIAIILHWNDFKEYVDNGCEPL